MIARTLKRQHEGGEPLSQGDTVQLGTASSTQVLTIIPYTPVPGHGRIISLIIRWRSISPGYNHTLVLLVFVFKSMELVFLVSL